MIVKALLAAIGLRSLPHLHNPRVHETRNKETAAIAAFRMVARRSQSVSHAIAADPDDKEGIARSVETMQADTDQVTGMLAGLMQSMEPDE